MTYYQDKLGRPTTWEAEGSKKITKKAYDSLIVRESAAQIVRWLGDKPCVCVTVTQVASNGMSRHVLVQTVVDGKIADITRWVSDVLGWKLAKFNRLLVTGCGMDMRFHTADSLSWALYGKGDKITLQG